MNDPATDTALQPAATGAQLLVQLLEQQGVTTLSGVPGGANLPIYDALSQSRIRHILARHEQGAGFIAIGMARTTGMPGVCLASSGPGASNLVTAVADARMDSVPLVSITGQVPQSLIGTDAFQEIDTLGLMRPITKHRWMVENVNDLIDIIPEAFAAASGGRPGPVAIDIPKDIQLATSESPPCPPDSPAAPATAIEGNAIDNLLTRIHSAHRPLLMIGGGIVQAGATQELRDFAEALDLPAVQTFMGLGLLPHDHPLALGMLGMHGAPFTNRVLDECDLLIGLGVRFDDRATGKADTFCPNAEFIHVEIDRREIGKIIQPGHVIHGDVKQVLSAANEKLEPTTRPLWRQRIDQLRRHFPLQMPGSEDLFRPYGAIRQVAAAANPDCTVTTDVGQHQMWVAQAYPFIRPRQWLSSGGLGTMGYGLPVAIGAALAEPDRQVVCFSGDGSLMMNIQEIATAAEHSLNIKLVLLNNGHLGLVRQQQNLFYGGNLHAVEFQNPMDFVQVARGMGMPAVDLGAVDNPSDALDQAMNEPGPMLINIPINEAEMVLPMVPPGGANSDMIETVVG